MLKDVLQKLRVSDLQNEIRKVLTEFKGFKKMTKGQLIEVMLENEFLFKRKYDAIITTSNQDSHFEHVIVNSLAAPLSRVHFYSLLEYKLMWHHLHEGNLLQVYQRI